MLTDEKLRDLAHEAKHAAESDRFHQKKKKNLINGCKYGTKILILFGDLTSLFQNTHEQPLF